MRQAHVASRLAIAALLLVASQAGAATSLASPAGTPVIIGVNDGSGWGLGDSARLHLRGLTSERLEAGGPRTLAQSTAQGWRNDLVIVGNTPDGEPLSSVAIPSWTSRALAQVREGVAYGVTLFEVGNEMYLKGARCAGCGQQKEPVKYAEMYLSLARAVRAAGITGVKLLFNSFGDYLEEDGRWSRIAEGGGWLATAARAEPALLGLVSGFTMHPYGGVGENRQNDSGPGALEVQYEQAVSLGFRNTDYYLSEYGVSLAGEPTAGALLLQAQEIEAVYEELLAHPFVKGIWYYQSHDDPTGRWGLVEEQSSGQSPFIPRPALSVVAHFAVASLSPFAKLPITPLPVIEAPIIGGPQAEAPLGEPATVAGLLHRGEDALSESGGTLAVLWFEHQLAALAQAGR